MDEVLEVINKHILIADGEIVEVLTTENKRKKTISVTAKAKMEITNNSEISVNLVNPKYFQQSEVKYFAVTKEDCKYRSRDLYSSPFAQTVPKNKNFSELVSSINKNAVPENILISLEPAKKYSWDEEIYFEFHTTDTKRVWQGVSWIEFRNSGDSFWFWFEYCLLDEMSSLKPKLNEILSDEWRDSGEFPIARYQIKDISGQKHSLETRPILIDFTKAKVQELNDNDEKQFA
jgi:TusA-related sulfurtransferase